MLRVLLIEDSSDDALLIEDEFQEAGLEAEFRRVQREMDVREALLDDSWELIICDYNLGPYQAPEVLKWVAETGRHIPIIVVSGAITEEIAVDVMRAGAQDFCTKQNLARLVPAAERGIREARVHRARLDAEGELRKSKLALIQSEEMLKEAQKLEAIGKLAGGIAHDFNNLLTAMLGYCSLGLDRAAAEDPMHSLLLEIHSAGSKAAVLTQQLLAFGRRQLLMPRPLDLNENIRALIPSLCGLKNKNTLLTVELDPALGKVSADPKQIEQVMTNLFNNAQEALPEGGKISIQTCNAVLEGNQQAPFPPGIRGKFSRITVRDDGIGMDTETQLKIFEPYFTTKNFGARAGLGLGLSSVHGFVAQSGGHIAVESAPSSGSAFHIYLPWREEPAEPASLSENSPRGKDGKFVVVFDREKSVRRLIQLILEPQGYTFVDGCEEEDRSTMENIPWESVHSILLDWETAKILAPKHSMHSLRQVPRRRIILMSGFAEAVMSELKPPPCPARLLQKPFSSHRLLELIKAGMEDEKPYVCSIRNSDCLACLRK